MAKLRVTPETSGIFYYVLPRDEELLWSEVVEREEETLQQEDEAQENFEREMDRLARSES